VYVKDAADAYLTLADRAADDDVRGEAFNFSANVRLNVLDLVSSIARLMGKRHLQPQILNHAHHEIPYQLLSAAKATARLGWRPHHTLEQGLVETIDWYAGYLDQAAAA
jgi:CDP-glucose 4,6-dehydratase